MLQRCVLFFLVLFASLSIFAVQPVQSFKSGTYAQLLKQHNRSFLLVFWSLDCPPCYKELSILAGVMQKQPQLDLILVSTDKIDDINEIQQVLSEFKLSYMSAWVFDNDIEQLLRYEIDPNWYGVLPRSYLFDAQHNRLVISGVLNSKILQRWIKYSIKDLS